MTAAASVSPAPLEALLSGVHQSYALLAGLQLDLFTQLADGPRTVEQLAAAVGGDPQRLAALLHFLVSMEFLTVADGRFANTALADRWLVRGRPGSYVGMAGQLTEVWGAVAQTAASIQTGHACGAHDYTQISREQQLAIYQGLDAGVETAVQRLAAQVDFAGCRTVLDAGGGSGALAVALTRRYPHLRATVAELPNVVPLTAELVAAAGASDRVATLASDLLAGPLSGGFDVAILRSVVQVFGADEARQVIANVAAALRPGGTLCIGGMVADDSRLSPPSAVQYGFIAVSFYEQGQAYTGSEYRSWLAAAGLADVAFHWGPPGMGCLIVARKGSATA